MVFYRILSGEYQELSDSRDLDDQVDEKSEEKKQNWEFWIICLKNNVKTATIILNLLWNKYSK